jgi:hypothetical protein
VEVLEKLANTTEPPLDLEAIKSKREEFGSAQDREPLCESLGEMEAAFNNFGDLGKWDYEVLGDIDDCFVAHYMKNGDPEPYLFSPDSTQNLEAFVKYCDDVEVVLRKNSDKVPIYAQEYFAYYSIWEMRGYGFPIPLGTQSVVQCLDKILEKVKKGFIEVSLRLMA